MGKVVFILVLLALAWLALSVLGDELAGVLEVRRLEAQTELLQAEAERDYASAQRAQAEALVEMARAQRAQSAGIMALAVVLVLWSGLIGAGGVVLAVVALKVRRVEQLPPPDRAQIATGTALSWPVQRPIELCREEARRG